MSQNIGSRLELDCWEKGGMRECVEALFSQVKGWVPGHARDDLTGYTNNLGRRTMMRVQALLMDTWYFEIKTFLHTTCLTKRCRPEQKILIMLE